MSNISKNPNFKVVARAVRTEFESKSDALYLVFEIIDEQFKSKIKKDWSDDIELKIIDKKLVIEEE